MWPWFYWVGQHSFPACGRGVCSGALGPHEEPFICGQITQAKLLPSPSFPHPSSLQTICFFDYWTHASFHKLRTALTVGAVVNLNTNQILRLLWHPSPQHIPLGRWRSTFLCRIATRNPETLWKDNRSFDCSLRYPFLRTFIGRGRIILTMMIIFTYTDLNKKMANKSVFSSQRLCRRPLAGVIHDL